MKRLSNPSSNVQLGDTLRSVSRRRVLQGGVGAATLAFLGTPREVLAQAEMKKKLLLLSGLMIAALVVSGLWSTNASNLLVPEQTVEPTETTLAAGLSTQAQADKQTRARVSEAFGKLPLYFVENRGQFDKRVAYYVQGSDKTIYFSDQGLTFVLTGMRNAESLQPASFNPQSPIPSPKSDRWALKLDFVGARAGARAEGQEHAGATFNYFKGPSSKWQTGLRSYSQVVYRDLWPGIDLVYAGTVNRMKYTFVVKPGADPDQIKLAWRGASGVQLNTAGELEVTTPAGGFTDERPVSWQKMDGRQVEVATAYQLGDGGSKIENGSAQSALRDPRSSIFYGFKVGEYDRSRELVIDPVVLVYAGFIGGSGYDFGNGIAVDSAGNAYVTGLTESNETTFPVTGGPDLTFNVDRDAFVAKINAAGTALDYCGYIGGSGSDVGSGIAVDGAGNAYVTGATLSNETTFPVTRGPDLTFNGSIYDVFVAKINAAGTALDYCGYIGGSGFDTGYGIAVDSAGNAYVTGLTYSNETTFPVTGGPDLTFNGGDYDAFVAKVNAAGTALDYCGYIGGSGSDYGSAITVDSAGNAYVTGQISSNETTFPVTGGPDLTFNGGDSDAFVAKVNAAGTALDYCGYIGGSGFDVGYGIAVDSAGNAYVTGQTPSNETTFPVTGGPDLTFNGGDSDAFVAKVNAAGTALDYCGYIGGSVGDVGIGIAVDSAGNAYVTGATLSNETTFPVTGGPDLTFNGSIDVFVAKINASGTALDYCGYIGGSGADRGIGITVDSAGNAYVTGQTFSNETTFPVTGGPDLTFNGSGDVFVAKVKQDQGSALIAKVQALITAGTLTQDKGDGLIKKLNEVITKLDKGQTHAACNQLNAFIMQVQGFISSGTLTTAQGQALINAVNVWKTNIGC